MSGIKESNSITRQLFWAAYAFKKAEFGKGDSSQSLLGYLYDKIVFSKLKEKMGGQVRYLVTGKSFSRFISTKPQVHSFSESASGLM